SQRRYSICARSRAKTPRGEKKPPAEEMRNDGPPAENDFRGRVRGAHTGRQAGQSLQAGSPSGDQAQIPQTRTACSSGGIGAALTAAFEEVYLLASSRRALRRFFMTARATVIWRSNSGSRLSLRTSHATMATPSLAALISRRPRVLMISSSSP